MNAKVFNALRIEVRPAEGGADSKMFAQELAGAYVKLSQKLG